MMLYYEDFKTNSLDGRIALLFVWIDVGFLKNKLKNHASKNVIRFQMLVGGGFKPLFMRKNV